MALDLHVAAIKGDVRRVEELLARGAPVDALDEYRRTPLLRAAAGPVDRAAAIAEKLLDKGAAINWKDSELGQTCLHRAASNGALELVALLIKRGAPVDEVDAKGLTALHFAARHGRTEVSELLLKSGAQVDAVSTKWLEGGYPQNPRGAVTPMHLASRYGHAACLKLLIERGANLNAKTAKGDLAWSRDPICISLLPHYANQQQA